jgi:hypothetical protein
MRALLGDKGNISRGPRTLEARGLIVIGRSSGGKAKSLRLIPGGQKWAMLRAKGCEMCTVILRPVPGVELIIHIMASEHGILAA